MYKNMKKTVSIPALLVFLLFTAVVFTGCGKDDKQKNVVHPIDVMISVDYPSGAKIPDMENFKFKVEKGSNVLEATELYASLAEIPLLIDTTSNTVIGINNVKNTGKGRKGKRWNFKVNGKAINSLPSEKKLADGDRIQWSYDR